MTHYTSGNVSLTLNMARTVKQKNKEDRSNQERISNCSNKQPKVSNKSKRSNRRAGHIGPGRGSHFNCTKNCTAVKPGTVTHAGSCKAGVVGDKATMGTTSLVLSFSWYINSS